MTRPGVHDRLEGVLTEARRRSLIGKLPFAAQRAHSEGFLRALSLEAVNGPVLELGSGGGLPGLVLAVEDQELVSSWSTRRGVLPTSCDGPSRNFSFRREWKSSMFGLNSSGETRTTGEASRRLWREASVLPR